MSRQQRDWGVHLVRFESGTKIKRAGGSGRSLPRRPTEPHSPCCQWQWQPWQQEPHGTQIQASVDRDVALAQDARGRVAVAQDDAERVSACLAEILDVD